MRIAPFQGETSTPALHFTAIPHICLSVSNTTEIVPVPIVREESHVTADMHCRSKPTEKASAKIISQGCFRLSQT